MSRFLTEETKLKGLYVMTRKPLGDSRGYLERMYCNEELKGLIGERVIQQINHTLTEKQGTLRGLHYQKKPHEETKLVSCMQGSVFDVAVDVRPESPTYLQWHAEVLSAENHKTLCITEGFAHGFQTLEDNVKMLYLHTAAYAPNHEAGLNALDPKLEITWPVSITERSERDSSFKHL